MKKLYIIIILDLLLLVIMGIKLCVGFTHDKEPSSPATMVLNNSEADVKKKISLTFDDGPHPIFTPMLLDGLSERNVQATFFVIGEQAMEYKEIIKREHEEGHLIGNHTYTHVELSKLSTKEACKELKKTNEVIYDIIGEYPDYVRPPFGEWNDSLENKFNMIPVLWKVDPLDWKTEDISKVVCSVISNTQEGDVILMHDCYKSSVKAALSIIDILQEQGYEFVTVDKLILE